MATMSSDYHTNAAHDDEVWRPDGVLQTDTTNSNRTNAANRSSGRRSGSRSNGHHSGYSVWLSNLSGSNGNKSGSNGHHKSSRGSNGHHKSSRGSNGFHKSSRGSNGFHKSSGGGAGPLPHPSETTHNGVTLGGDPRSSPQPYTDPTASKQTTGESSPNKKTTNGAAAGVGGGTDSPVVGSPDGGSENDEDDDHTETFVMQTGVAFAAPGSSPEPPVEPDRLEATPAPKLGAPMDDETNKRGPREGTQAPPNPPLAVSSDEASSGKEPVPAAKPAADYADQPPSYRRRRVPVMKPHPYQERTVPGQPSTSQPSSGMRKARAQQLQQQQLLRELQQVPAGHHMPAHARAAAASASAAATTHQQTPSYAPAAAPSRAAPASATTTNVPKPHWPPQSPPQQANPFAQIVNQARGTFGADHGFAQQLPAPQMHHLPQQQAVENANTNYQQWLKYNQQQQAQTQQAQQQWEYAPPQVSLQHQAHQQQGAFGAPMAAETYQGPRRGWGDPNTGQLYAAQAPAQATHAPAPRTEYYYGGQFYWTPAPQAVPAQQDWMLQPHTYMGHENAQTKPQEPPETKQAHQAQTHQAQPNQQLAPAAPQHQRHHQRGVAAQPNAGYTAAVSQTAGSGGSTLQQGWRMLTHGQIGSVDAPSVAAAAPAPPPTAAAYGAGQLQPAPAPAAAHYSPALHHGNIPAQYAQPGNGSAQAVHYPQSAAIHGNGSGAATYYPQPVVPAETLWQRFPTTESSMTISPASDNGNGIRGPPVHQQQPSQAAASYADTAYVGNGNGGNGGTHHSPTVAPLMGGAAVRRPPRRRLRPRQRASRYMYPRQRNGSKLVAVNDEGGGWNYRRRKRSRNNIYIKNMHLETTKQDVVQFFRRYGPIGSVRMLTDQITNLFLGRCMIQFVHDASATKCVNAMKRKLDRVQAYFGDRVYADFAFEQNPNRAGNGSAWVNAHSKEVAPAKPIAQNGGTPLPFAGPPHEEQSTVAQHEKKQARDEDLIAQLIDGPAPAAGGVDGDVDANVSAPARAPPLERASPSTDDSGYSTERDPLMQRASSVPPAALLPAPQTAAPLPTMQKDAKFPDPHPLGTYLQEAARPHPQLVIGPLAHIFTQNSPGPEGRMRHSQAFAQSAPPMAATMQQLPVVAAPAAYKNGNGNGGFHPNGDLNQAGGGHGGAPGGDDRKSKRKKRGKRH